MRLSFNTLVGSFLNTQRLESEVTDADVSIKNDNRVKLSNSDKLKLSK